MVAAVNPAVAAPPAEAAPADAAPVGSGYKVRNVAFDDGSFSVWAAIVYSAGTPRPAFVSILDVDVQVRVVCVLGKLFRCEYGNGAPILRVRPTPFLNGLCNRTTYRV